MASDEGIQVLLVEDNASDAELALHALKKSKLVSSVVHLQDGEAALDFLFCRAAFSDRRFEAPPCLVLMDLNLPKRDGLQVLQELKSDLRTKAIPVILLTSSKEERDMVAGYHLGVNSYIQKPVSFSEFQDVVRQLGLYWLQVNSKPPTAAFSI
jgi:two-component system, response regulator